MLSEQKTQEVAQAHSLGQAFSPTATARLEPASIRDLRTLAASFRSSSRAPGLREEERVQLQIQAQHALLIVDRTSPFKSRKARRLGVARRKQRIESMHRRQQDLGFAIPGFRTGPNSWSQHDEDLRPGSRGSVDMSQSREFRG